AGAGPAPVVKELVDWLDAQIGVAAERAKLAADAQDALNRSLSLRAPPYVADPAAEWPKAVLDRPDQLRWPKDQPGKVKLDPAKIPDVQVIGVTPKHNTWKWELTGPWLHVPGLEASEWWKFLTQQVPTLAMGAGKIGVQYTVADITYRLPNGTRIKRTDV